MANCEVVYPEEGYLSGLRRLTTENDILLIYDEIITGLRLALGGADKEVLMELPRPLYVR